MSRPAFPLVLLLLLPSMAGAGAATGTGTFDSLVEFVQAVGMKKGLWRTRVRVTAAEIQPSPGADPAHVAEVRARIERQVGLVEEKDECLLAPSKGGLRLPGILLNQECSYTRLRAGGGRWALSCAVSTRDEMSSMESKGTYARRAVTGSHKGEITRKGVLFRVKARTESRYVGECRPLKPFDVTGEGD